MPLTATVSPTLYLAGDLDSSASKFFYRVHPGQVAPLWMGSEVVHGLTPAAIPSFMGGDRPQEQAWLQIEEEVIFVGDIAKTLLDSNSIAANKSEKAVYKLLAALGAIAQIEQLADTYDAVIWLTLPLTEIRTHEASAQQLTKLCQSGFIFRGKFQRVNLSFKCFPEGFGLYLNRKKQLATCGVSIEQRRTLILMLGHRNLSIPCFEGGSLKPQNSSSDGPGFWTAFERGARSIGVTPVDYTALLSALTTGKTHQISQARASLYDFTQAASAICQTYWQGVSSYLQDHLMNQLENVELDMIVSGGAAWVVRSQVQSYFDELGYGTSFSFADAQHYHLTEIVNQMPEARSHTALALRMTDCYGLFQGLLGKLNLVAMS